MTDPMLPLKELLQKEAREAKTLRMPAFAAIPAKFTAVSPLDLFRSFKLNNLDHKGQACTGTTEVGWSIEVGAKDFDLSVMVSTMPDSIAPGSLTPTLTFTYSKLVASMLLIQRLPDRVEFLGNGGFRWEADQEKKVSFVSMGGLWYREKNSQKIQKSVNIGMDLQLGYKAGQLVENRVQGTAYTDTKGDEKKAFGETNDVSLGFDAQLMLGVSWSSMILLDPEPAYYPNGNDDRLSTDFISLVAFAESKRVIVELFKWLCYAASLKSRKNQISKPSKQTAVNVQKEIVSGGQAGRLTVKLLDGAKWAAGVLFDKNNKLSITIKGLRDTIIAGREIGAGDLDKQRGYIQDLQTTVRALKIPFQQEQTVLQNEFINGNWRDSKLKLDYNFVEFLDIDSFGGRLEFNQAQIDACKRLIKRLNDDVKAGRDIPLFEDGSFNETFLKSVLQSAMVPPSPSDEETNKLISFFKERIPRFPRMEARMNLAAGYARLVVQCDYYNTRLQTLLDKIGNNTIPQKRGRLPNIADTDWFKRLNFVKVKTTEKSLDLSVGARAIVPLLGQTLSAAAAGGKVTLRILESVTTKARTSRYRLQTTAVSAPAILRFNTLVITQDTDLIYSQAALSAEAYANLTLASEAATVSKGIAIGNQGMLNSVNYRSAVGYWHYEVPGNMAKLGQGSGVNFGYSVPTSMLEKLGQIEVQQKCPSLIEAMADFCYVSPRLIELLIQFSKIGNLRQQDPDTAERLPTTLIIEAGFSFLDDFLRDPNQNQFNLTNKGDGTVASPRHKEIESILDKPSTRAFIKDIKRRKDTNDPILPDWLRLRYSRGTSVDNSDRKFTLGVLVKVPFLIDLKPIEKAGTESLEDLYTLFVRDEEYNARVTNADRQSQSVPPVILLTQA